MSQHLNEKQQEPAFNLTKNALQRGSSDFRADYEITDNPYSVNDTNYYLLIQGFSEAKEATK